VIQLTGLPPMISGSSASRLCFHQNVVNGCTVERERPNQTLCPITNQPPQARLTRLTQRPPPLYSEFLNTNVILTSFQSWFIIPHGAPGSRHCTSSFSSHTDPTGFSAGVFGICSSTVRGGGASRCYRNRRGMVLLF
jgi:hypothetical protein